MALHVVGLVYERSIVYFLDELIFTLLTVWVSEFGIRDWYTNFKIALDTALLLKMDLTLAYFTVQRYW